jgi:hypothetical protein
MPAIAPGVTMENEHYCWMLRRRLQRLNATGRKKGCREHKCCEKARWMSLRTPESKVAGLSLALGLGCDHAQCVQLNRLRIPAAIQVNDRSMKHLRICKRRICCHA